MPNSYKNIVIVPNINSSTDDPRIRFSGANTAVNTDITLKVYPLDSGTIAFEGATPNNELFSIANSMVGITFSVNNANGVPNIEVTDNDIIRIAQFTGNVQVGSTMTVTGVIETIFSVTGNTPALSPVNGTIQTWTLPGATNTPTQGAWANGASMTLQVRAGSNTITWSSVPVAWVGNTAPTLAATGNTVLELWKTSNTVYGATVGNVT